MLPGPVFQFELLTTSRRGRFYVMRAAYAAVLLLIFWVIHADWSTRGDNGLTINQMSWLAIICFCSVAVAQVVAVLCLTPALVAGVIADERQRRTLHYLLASRLTGPEIVLGKLSSRMLHLGVLLAVGLPILSLLVLLGGIDPRLIVLACGTAASTAWWLAALSVWVSTIARRARDALFIAYGLEFLWLFIPFMVPILPPTGWPALDRILDGAYEVWITSSPLGHARQVVFGMLAGTGVRLPDVGLMIAYQAIGGLILAVLAAVQLRPVFRASEGGRTGWRLLRVLPTTRHRLRLWPRPAPGDRPMLWKELFTSRARGFARFVGFLVALVGGGTLLYYTIWFGALAFLEHWDLGGRGGMGNQPGGFLMFSTHRWQFRAYLQVVLPFVYIAGILSVAGAAAASITSEHEEDTWVSLTSTDLSGREILLAKLYGALWRPRMIVVAMLLMAFLGAISGSIHPLGLPALGVSLAVFGWFAAALGLWISLQLRSTWRAQFLTTSSLLLVNLLGQAILSNVQRYSPLVWPGFTPMDICKTMLFPDLAPGLRDEFRRWKYAIPPVDHGEAWALVFWVLSLTVYLAGAGALTWLALRRFDAVAGRARRNSATVTRSNAPEETPGMQTEGTTEYTEYTEKGAGSVEGRAVACPRPD